MGVVNNECVIATTWNSDVMAKIKKWVSELDGDSQRLFLFTEPLINNRQTVFIAPCGSKKGWTEDEAAEALRNDFVSYLSSFDYEDGSSPLDWVEVGYGEYGQMVLRGNCRNVYNDLPYAEPVDS